MKDIAKFIDRDRRRSSTSSRACRSSGPSSARARSAAARSIENRKGYSCWSREDPGCGFVIWKKKAGKNLPVAVAKELMASLKAALERGDEPPIGRTEKQVTGFRGRSGRSFRAKLGSSRARTTPGKWKVEFDEEWADRPRAEPRRGGGRGQAADGEVKPKPRGRRRVDGRPRAAQPSEHVARAPAGPSSPSEGDPARPVGVARVAQPPRNTVLVQPAARVVQPRRRRAASSPPRRRRAGRRGGCGRRSRGRRRCPGGAPPRPSPAVRRGAAPRPRCPGGTGPGRAALMRRHRRPGWPRRPSARPARLAPAASGRRSTATGCRRG